MQVILLKEWERLGKIGDAVNVADGYARNFLFPKKVAVAATASNLERVKKLKKEQEAIDLARLEEAKALASRMEALVFSIAVKAGEDDKMFGSVTTADIEELLKAQSVVVDKKKILLEEPIKVLGEHAVSIKIHPEVTASCKIQVVRE